MGHLLPSFFVLALFSNGATAQDWAHWRGPNFDGSSTAEGLASTFSKTENVRWSAELPGTGASTPIVVGERIFLTSIDEESDVLLALCVDRETGEELWVDTAGSGYRPKDKGSNTSIGDRSNYASPSAVSDGKRVVFFYGNGDLVCYSLDGAREWERNLQQDYGDFAFQWTFSVSPTLFEGQIFLPILQRNEPANGIGKKGAESFLLALDAETGKTNYRHVRSSKAVMESLESYATAIPYVGEGRKEILVVGGDVITGHNPGTGAELWRWGTWNEGHREAWWRVVPSPVVGGGVALACGPKGAAVCAVKLGGDGLLGEEHVAWKSSGRRDPVTTDVPTPLYYLGDFFVLSDLRNSLTRVNAATGEQRWSIKLSSEYKWRSSPTGADGRVWLMDHGGNVVVINAEDGMVTHRAEMGEGSGQVRSTVVAAGNCLYIRTDSALYCIGE
jgi:outer membrane protein assembly factor BamB